MGDAINAKSLETTVDVVETVPTIGPAATAFLPDSPCCVAFSNRICEAVVGSYKLVESTTGDDTRYQHRTGSVRLVRVTDPGWEDARIQLSV